MPLTDWCGKEEGKLVAGIRKTNFELVGHKDESPVKWGWGRMDGCLERD